MTFEKMIEFMSKGFLLLNLNEISNISRRETLYESTELDLMRFHFVKNLSLRKIYRINLDFAPQGSSDIIYNFTFSNFARKEAYCLLSLLNYWISFLTLARRVCKVLPIFSR
jgi:hypothetical protein